MKKTVIFTISAVVIVIFTIIMSGCASQKDILNPTEISSISIDYYGDIEEYTTLKQSESVEVTVSEDIASISEIINQANSNIKSTSQPIDFPRYVLSLKYVNGNSEIVTIDQDNRIASELFGGGNYLPTNNANYYLLVSNLMPID